MKCTVPYIALIMIDLNEVAVFIKVIETGSFSGAARALGTPRATVSRKVSQLESSLGVRLLQRTTRKLNLTESGRDYYLKCSSALSEIEHANLAVTETQQHPSGTLRIAAPLASRRGVINDWITEFLLLHENVTAEVSLSDDVVDLIEDGFDVAFRAGKLKDSSLVARKLGDTRLVLCASPAYLKQAAPLDTLKDLKHHDCILFGSTQKQMSWHLQTHKRSEAVQVSGRVTVNSMEFALESCLAGLGVALLPVAMIAEYVASKKLHLVLDQYATEAGGIFIIYPSKSHLPVTVRAFVDFVMSRAGDGLPWDNMATS